MIQAKFARGAVLITEKISAAADYIHIIHLIMRIAQTLNMWMEWMGIIAWLQKLVKKKKKIPQQVTMMIIDFVEH